jgi:hypothetical protein
MKHADRPTVAAVLGRFLLVVVGAAVLLRLVDWLPVVLGGEPRGVRRFDSVEDVEHETGVGVRLPAFFPDTLGWPARRVRLAVGRPPTVSVVFAARGRAEAELNLCETLGGYAAIPAVLLQPGLVLETAETTVAGRPAEIVRVSEDGGRLVHDVRWDSADRTIRLRFSGPLPQLLRMADSLERNRR